MLGPRLVAGLLLALLTPDPALATVFLDEVEVPCTEEVIGGLVSHLEHADPSFREVAAHQLKQCPELAAELGAVPILARMAGEEPVQEVREAALWALAEMGPPALAEAQPVLIELMDMGKPTPPGMVRGIAAYAYGRMEPDAETAGKVLLPVLLDMDEFNRRAAADAIAQVGEPLLPLLLFTLTQMEGRMYQAGVVEALGLMGETAAPAVPALEALHGSSSSTWVKDEVRRALARIQPDVVGDQVKRLMDEIDGGRDSTRYLGICDLGDLGEEARPAIGLLLDALDDPHTARVAAEALTKVAPESRWPEVARRMEPLLAMEDWEGQMVAGYLAALGAPGQGALERALVSDDPVARRNSLRGLADLEPSKGTFKPLKQLLKDHDAEARTAAAQVLALHGERALLPLEGALRREQESYPRAQLLRAMAPLGEAAAPIWRAELGHESEEVRHAAVYRLAELGEAAAGDVRAMLVAGTEEWGGLGETAREVGLIGAPAVPGLMEALADEDARLRADAAYALGVVDEGIESAIPALARALDDPEEDVRQWSAWALGNHGEVAAGAVEDLRAALTDPETWVRQNAAEALGRVGDAARPAIPDLVAVVEYDRSLMAPEKAAESLGQLGAIEAVDALTRAMAKDNDYLRTAAARALLAIGESTPEVRRALREGLSDPKARVRWACADALMVLGDDSDQVEAMIVRQRAPDDAWEESMQAMEEFGRMMDEIEPPPPEEE